MEFNKKLQELRKQKGLTQEELAELLFVSRTAVSKWESGRGYPTIDSLKQIAKFYGITVDELLSGEELLSIAKEETNLKEDIFKDLVFGLLDISSIFLFFLPFFAQKSTGIIDEVSLLSLNQITPHLKVSYFSLVIIILVFGILTITLQNYRKRIWIKVKTKASLFLNILGVLLFMISLQPYAAIFLFIFLVIKVLILLKK